MQKLVNAEVTGRILKCAIEVHKTLGPGLLENAYRACLMHELFAEGMKPESEVPLPLRYKGVDLDCGYRADLIVDNQVLVELKVVDTLLPIHRAQPSLT